jgi:hypothetical protein
MRGGWGGRGDRAADGDQFRVDFENNDDQFAPDPCADGVDDADHYKCKKSGKDHGAALSHERDAEAERCEPRDGEEEPVDELDEAAREHFVEVKKVLHGISLKMWALVLEPIAFGTWPSFPAGDKPDAVSMCSLDHIYWWVQSKK